MPSKPPTCRLLRHVSDTRYRHQPLILIYSTRYQARNKHNKAITLLSRNNRNHQSILLHTLTQTPTSQSYSPTMCLITTPRKDVRYDRAPRPISNYHSGPSSAGYPHSSHRRSVSRTRVIEIEPRRSGRSIDHGYLRTEPRRSGRSVDVVRTSRTYVR